MYYIGIDLGGTNIKGALVSETGEIAREGSRPTRVELGAVAVCDGIAAVITELSSGVDRTSLGGVGLGCPPNHSLFFSLSSASPTAPRR